ncbi:MAG TPA: SusC/RagA family TonB-linked outer membrane protein [Gemmatimonadaceae bacterium]|nr:SusC/RagA family TonB-linked outer membrane protein [Gemmatimonadaceae bacterium]
MLQHCRRPLLAAAFALLPATLSAQQPVTISGRVTSDAGVPLQSANVFLEGMALGAITNAEGRYTFTVPAARATGQTATLTARLIGYRPTSVPVTLTAGTPITHDFALAANPLQLGEVVVTGAGTSTTRERVGAVINSVDAELLNRASEPQNVVSALAGKAPNVDIRTQSGEPGASAAIRIRGATSIGVGSSAGTAASNQPLFVVDGQPIDNSTVSTEQGPADFPGSSGTVQTNRAADINPNDIESVEILKGAGAAAIYGAQAANGVVLITTKKGRPGRTRYTLQSTETFDRVIKTMPLQRTYGLGVILDDTARSPSCTATTGEIDCRPSVPDFGGVNMSWGPALAPGTKTFDHAGEIYDTGITADNNLTISGGSERTTFFLSGGLTNQDGTIVGPNNSYDRTSVRLKATQQVGSKLNIGGNFSYIDTRGAYVQKGSNVSGLLLGALRTPPEFDNRQYLDSISGLHRSYRFPHPSAASLQDTRGYDNPFFTINNPGNKSELGRFIGNVNFDWTPMGWLTVRYTLGSDYYSEQRVEALPFTSSSNPVGQVTRLDLNNLSIDHNLLAIASYQYSPNISGRLTLGQNLNSRRYRQTWAQGQNLNAPDPLALQNTLNIQLPQENKSLRHIEGYFGQLEADLYEQVFLNVGVRNDGFSTFGSRHRRAWYPKAQAVWVFSNALGITDQQGPFSYGKLRFSYGETGREPPVYSTVPGVYTLGAVFGSGYGDFINASQNLQGGVSTPIQATNPDLKPERNREFEVGTDLSFLNQMVDLGVTYYDKRSSDVILAVPTSAAQTGSQSIFKNGARVTNKGWEITLGARPVTKEQFGWDFNVNFGQNRGKVTDLLGAQFVTYNSEGFTGAIGSATVGYAPGVLRGSDWARCGITSDNFVVDDAGTTLGSVCGGAKKGALYLDATGLPVLDPTDRVIADPNPRWSAGVSTTVRLGRNLRLGGTLDIRHGNEVWNGTKGALYRFGTHKDTDIRNTQGTYLDIPGMKKRYDRGVVGPGVGVIAFQTPEDWQNWFLGEGGGFGDNSAQFIEDGSFVKLRELSIAYSFDQPWVKRVGLETIDLRLAGRNLHTWTDYSGLDPETNLGGAEWLTQGVDYFSSPLTRSFVLSLTLNR